MLSMRMKLFYRIFDIELRKQMSYRTDFWVNTFVSFIGSLAVMYFLWKSIFSSNPGIKIGGYTLEGMVTYYAYVILISRLIRGSEHMMGIATDIYDGGLSRYQVYPTSYLGFKYAQHLGSLLPAAIQVIFFIVLTFFFDITGSVNFSSLNISIAIFVILIGNLLYYTINIPVQLIAFWADNVWSLTVMVIFIGGLLGGVMLPLELFPEWAFKIIKYSPFVYLYHFPVEILTGKISTPEIFSGIFMMFFWIIIMAVISKITWYYGNKKYTGVGI
jgi:ABC-2 type transport system permease protein